MSSESPEEMPSSQYRVVWQAVSVITEPPDFAEMLGWSEDELRDVIARAEE